MSVFDTAPNKERRVLDKDDLDSLLNFLDPNRDLAALAFESIRIRLITFFECRHCHRPEDCADIAIYRVAQQIRKGTKILTNKPLNYFLGVAYKVLHEYWRDPSTNFVSLDDSSVKDRIPENDLKANDGDPSSSTQEQEMGCLELCLESLSPSNRALIIRYYEYEGKAKKKSREKLAEQLGIPLNALRIRALRIRKRMEECVKECLERLPNA